ncbi:MAG: glycoside hydrolase family 43 protein [Saprospiraceae bacterium]|nr:glycoside hydrolase family 43 protein [Saprospiraceae bacterium]
MKVVLIVIILQVSTLAMFGQELNYTNPVSDSVFAADPYVLFQNGIYYLYATNAGDGFKYWTSKNLVDWEDQGYAFQKTDSSWGQRSFWAPEVLAYRDKFYLIYSAYGETMFGGGLRLCLAVADRPEGPFIDLQAPLFDLGFSCIDGHLFVDTDDKPYLYYEMVGAVGEHWKEKGYLWGVIMGVELSGDLLRMQHEPILCMYVDQEWEGPKSMKARSTEGMTVMKHGGMYYMTYSANHYADPNYGVGYATCDRPLGLWVKSENNPILSQDLSIGVSGPGHNSIISSPDRKEWFMVYHTHANPEKPSGKRVLNIDRMIFHMDGTLSIDGPTRTPQPMPSGSPEKKK